MSYEPEGYGEGPGPRGDTAVARSKVGTPAVLLIVVGILNLLLGLGSLGFGAQWALKSVDQVRAEQEKGMEVLKQIAPNAQEEVQKQAEKQSPEQLKTQNTITYLGLGAVNVVGALITLFGGIKMRNLQSYGLAVFGSVLALIPCISPCCILGQVAGIWGLVVLMNQDVKSAFR